MRSEDFPDDPKQNHPEVASNPEAIQPAEQVTLGCLLAIITDKTKGDSAPDPRMGKGADLFRPGEGKAVASAWKSEKGMNRHNPEKVGHITRLEAVGEQTIYTSYSILDTQDGLHIAKCSRASNPLEEGASLVSIMAAEAAEDEFGLGFVSEQEARELIDFLEPLEPYT